MLVVLVVGLRISLQFATSQLRRLSNDDSIRRDSKPRLPFSGNPVEDTFVFWRNSARDCRF